MNDLKRRLEALHLELEGMEEDYLKLPDADNATDFFKGLTAAQYIMLTLIWIVEHR